MGHHVFCCRVPVPSSHHGAKRSYKTWWISLMPEADDWTGLNHRSERTAAFSTEKLVDLGGYFAALKRSMKGFLKWGDPKIQKRKTNGLGVPPNFRYEPVIAGCCPTWILEPVASKWYPRNPQNSVDVGHATYEFPVWMGWMRGWTSKISMYPEILKPRVVRGFWPGPTHFFPQSCLLSGKTNMTWSNMHPMKPILSNRWDAASLLVPQLAQVPYSWSKNKWFRS